MKTEQINKLTSENYKIKIVLTSDKKYENMILKTYFYNDNTNIVYPVYYNHVKNLLNQDQLLFIDTYNTVKNFTFRDKVELNVKYHENKETTQDIANRIMLRAITKKEYIEQQ